MPRESTERWIKPRREISDTARLALSSSALSAYLLPKPLRAQARARVSSSVCRSRTTMSMQSNRSRQGNQEEGSKVRTGRGLAFLWISQQNREPPRKGATKGRSTTSAAKRPVNLTSVEQRNERLA